MKKLWTKIDKVSKNGAGVIEWILFVAIAVLSYVFFTHQDILVTAGHSLELLNGHITDFYSACKKTDGTYGANYFPTTFIIFAIWNIPTKLLGMAPTFVGDWSVPFIMWNKLLPTIAFAISGVILYKIVTKRLGFEKSKASLTVLLFFTSPMAFFSQFLFCQYDIFTVLFMLLGMNHYFKKEMKKSDYFWFALFFGIATTFKYFALLIFVVLLLLKIKNVFEVILVAIPAGMPLFLELAFYVLFDRRAFIKSVFGFAALDNATGFDFNIGGVHIQGVYFILVILIAAAYFTKPTDFEQLVSYGMFYSCGICFTIFGLMVWYPQWLLFMTPFWVISIVINKHNEIFLWIDALLGVLLDVYIVNAFIHAVDQELFRFGIFHDRLMYSTHTSVTMSDIFIFKDQNILYTLISAIFLIGFIFKHPKFNFDKIAAPIESGRFILNTRFVAFTCAFLVAAFACLPNFLDRDDVIAARFGGSHQNIEMINNKKSAEQYMKLDAKNIQRVKVVCDSARGIDDEKTNIVLTITDTETGKVVAKGKHKEKDIIDGSHDYTTIKLEKPFTPNPETLYKFTFSTDSKSKVAIFFEYNAKETATYYRVVKRDYSECYATYNGKKDKKREIVMYVIGERP